ncbi:MAG: hypothetical protein ACRC57_05440 [Sarcina sp.]
MTIVNITYKVDLDIIERNLEEHRNFLDKNYNDKNLCVLKKISLI